MRCFPLFLFALMLPVSVLAEPVTVVSGEHDGYTRLVFSVSPDREWNLTSGENTATLEFPAQSLEFEDDGVFARIAKTRLLSISSEQREAFAIYTMTLACDCEVTAFPYLGEYIVVDIADPSETVITPPPRRFGAPTLHAASAPDGSGRPPELVSWVLPRAPYYVSSPHNVSFPTQTDDIGLVPAQIPDAPPRSLSADVIEGESEMAPKVDQELQDAVDAARNSLLQQLTLAADQGLLDLNGPIPEILQAAEIEHKIVPVKPIVEPPTVFAKLEDENQVLIQTVITRDARAVRGGGNLQNDSCPTPEDLNIASWGSGDDFFEELSSARQGLLKEFDEPDFTQIQRLVRTYLRYGFGAEAKSYLLEGGQSIEQYSLLLDFAAIVDGQPIQAGGPLSQAIECDGLAGLWALVGVYPAIDTQINNEPSIVAAFAQLPPDIRRMVGPKLSSAFLDRGLEGTARQISDILERAPGDHGTEQKLVTGNLMQAEGSTPEAGQAYQDLVDENSATATDALIALAALRLTQDQPPPPHLLIDLDASAKIWRGTQKGGELRRVEALWLAKQGREAEAIDQLVAEIGRDPVNTEILQETAENILSALSVRKSLKRGYAAIVDTYIGFIPETEEADKLRLEIAAKLLLASLPDYALEILRPMLERRELSATLIAASANIQAFRPDAAISLLNGVEGDAAKKLRVEAYLGIGSFERALEQLEQFADISDAVAMPYWFNGDWAAVVEKSRDAAEISGRFFPIDVGSTQRPDVLLPDDALSLTALQKLLAVSQLRSAELENVLLQQ